MSLDDPFDTEPPTDVRALTEIPEERPTEPPSLEEPTDTDLAYYVCPACRAKNPLECLTCSGVGLIDRETMREWKKENE